MSTEKLECESCQPELVEAKKEAPSLIEDAVDSSSFIPPHLPSTDPAIVIEFCHKCRWLHRATWIQTELFVTFPPPVLKSITLIPLNTPETGGRFRVWLFTKAKENSSCSSVELVWDRKTQNGFPELKDLKQRIRDRIQPGTSLGHSDRKAKTSEVMMNGD